MAVMLRLWISVPGRARISHDFSNEITLLCGGKSVLTKGLLEHCRAEKSTLIAEGVKLSLDCLGLK